MCRKNNISSFRKLQSLRFRGSVSTVKSTSYARAYTTKRINICGTYGTSPLTIYVCMYGAIDFFSITRWKVNRFAWLDLTHSIERALVNLRNDQSFRLKQSLQPHFLRIFRYAFDFQQISEWIKVLLWFIPIIFGQFSPGLCNIKMCNVYVKGSNGILQMTRI